ncbi:type I restriction-modification system methyltransferase subunit [Belliella baltica DSM 15883]|uniref:site-specific DNA-methyltransferase (adenine-specific) n=1 Tax=Belliella baltica (strain DSM 15883 / CIP 108006 / LMG 21964 / BA134) TaxID=866536 RepID=I3ZA89_BELBD|nr:N-6 DNA methylase [Belliella baltica]AFL86157.1 type I restriction-modification system methyltransferase subunit [Belliella baltica DSM 15883]
MSAEQIAKKLWELCNVLRDDGVTYHQYLNELTYILFLRLSEVKKFDHDIPEKYRWSNLKGIKDNKELFDIYRDLLANLGAMSSNETITEIYTNASTTLRKPVNLRTLITNIDQIDWYEDEEQDKIASIYEELLEKNAGEKKSGAGQYFTPRPLINVMIELLSPKIGERWNDPAAGTFGFMIAADEYLKRKYDDYYALSQAERSFQVHEAFSGCELVQDAHRLALMNAKLHGLESRIVMGDTLTEQGKSFKNYDGVLANPPFGTKQGGERPTRDDFTIQTSNKQLNFLMHIYRSLRRDTGTARAAVVLPDNVLFEDNDGQKIRRDLMEKCDLHTVLRLPTGIFYAAGVKTNVLFFTRGKKETGNTKRVWFYDMRTNAPSYGKRTPFTREAFAGFVTAYTGGTDMESLKQGYEGEIDNEKRKTVADPRWQVFTREQIAAKNDSLDIGLIEDENISKNADLGDPLDIARLAAEELDGIKKELDQIISLLG